MMKLFLAIGTVAAVCIACVYLAFVGNDAGTSPRGTASSTQTGRKDTTAEAEIHAKHSPEVEIPAQTTPKPKEETQPDRQAEARAAEREKIRAEVEAAFQEFMETETWSSNFHEAARTMARVAARLPEVIVEKLRTGDDKVLYRATVALNYFSPESADGSGVVSLLVDLYTDSDQDLQMSVLRILRNTKPKSALPFLRTVLDDTCLQPTPPPGTESLIPQPRMCDSAYYIVLKVLDRLGIRHGLKKKKGSRATWEQLDAMKKWLDEHPELLKPPETQEQKDKKQ
jgi:hypothetical protein